jgi:diguanylate cyclase (GGDEF)-like protein/PAS domain S-box-containing protein
MAIRTLDTGRTKETTAELDRLNRSLRIQDRANRALVLATVEASLLQELCNILVDFGYCTAWVGYAGNLDSKSIHPVAISSNSGDTLEDAKLTWADADQGKGPAGTAIRSGRSAVILDLSGDALARPWRAAALQRKLKSCMCLPLKDATANSFGVLAVYASDPNILCTEEVRLLEQLTGDMSRAIVTLRIRDTYRNTENALIESEKKLADAVRIAHVGYWERDFVAGTISLSEEACRIFGLPVNYRFPELSAWHQQWDRLLHPEDRKDIEQAYLEALEGTCRYDVKYRVIQPGGETRHVHSFADVTRGESGKPIRMFGTMIDITNQVETQDALQSAAEEIRDLYNHAPCGYHSLDKDGTFVRINETELEWLGYSRDELVGKKKLSDLLTPDSREIYHKHFPRFLETGVLRDVEFEMIRKDGTRLQVIASATAVTGKDGKFQMSRSMLYDITERKRMEQGLRASEEMFSAAFHASPDLLAITRADGTILDVNEGYTRLLGYTRAESIGKTTAELSIWHDAADRAAFVRRLQEFGQINDFETTLRRKDGTLVTVIDSARTMELHGEKCVLSIVRDVSRLKLIEDSLVFVAQQGWASSDDNYFDALARFLGEKLDMDYVLIDKLAESPGFAQTVSAYAKGKKINDMCYALKGTPCENVMGRQICVYPKSAQQLFPDDLLLCDMGVESYVGIPLWDSLNKPIGLIALLSCKPMIEGTLATQVLQVVAARTAAELERESSDRLLRASEHEFRTLAENLPDNIIRYDREGRVIYCNPNLERTIGVPASAAIGKRVGEVLLDGRYADYAEVLEEVLVTGEDREMEYILPIPSPEPVIHQIRFIVERDKNGELSGVLAIGRDITERKRTEEALSMSAQHFRSLAENSPDNVIRYDRECRTRYCNPVMLKTIGVNAEAILGRTPVELGFGGPELSREFQEHVQRVLDSGEQNDMELIMRLPDHRNGTHLIRFAPERDLQGRITGVLAIGRDITALKQAEAERHASLHFFESMDRINRAIRGGSNLDQVMSDVLDVVMNIFGCDRVFMMYPCDPDAASWSVPIERCRPEYPGIGANSEIPMDGEIAAELRRVLASEGPLKSGAKRGIHSKVAKQFNVLSSMSMALYPNTGKPWQFGIHQCAYMRVWTREEERLLHEIGQRMLDALNNLLAYRELAISENKYHTLFEESQDALYISSPDGSLIDANRRCAELFGYGSKADMERINLARDIYANPAERQALLAEINALGSCERELVLKKKNGDLITALCMVTAERNADGTVNCYRGIVHDISAQRRTEEQLRIAATAFEAQEGIVITDSDKVILRVNNAFTEITGYSAEEAVGQTPRLLRSGHHDDDFYRKMWKTISISGSWQGEIWNRRKSGEIYPEWLNITAVKSDVGGVTHYVGTLTDITARKAAEAKIEQLAFYDQLTSLPNRRLLLDRLQQALASNARSERAGALMLIDLDNFKVLNDTRGHGEGDLLLQQVAKRLVDCVREGDTVARLGGDEFVVILSGLSMPLVEAAEQTGAIGKKILAALSMPYQLGGYEFVSTSSVGATLFFDTQQPKEELLKQADISMYEAKKSGGDALRFFDRKMQETVNARAALEKELRTAIEEQQFQLHYQVQMKLDDIPKVLGAEALLRWRHPDRGIVTPATFIPLAEETGLILPIGQWVLETACGQIKAWQDRVDTRKFVIAINVSAIQFHQEEFVDQVKSTVRKYQINPALLKLELTESIFLERIEEAVARMNALKEVGVQFSLDDFGTGYSSLQYLKRLPLNQVKIDQSFVRDIATDSSDTAIVRTIIAMAQSLDLDVIAEGVESEVQKELLADMGCTHCQGYLFGRPVSIEQFEVALNPDGT